MKSFIEFVSEEVWDEPNPKKKHKKLSSSKKAKAKARAKAAGRPYPNLIDNMAVAREEVEYIDEAGIPGEPMTGEEPVYGYVHVDDRHKFKKHMEKAGHPGMATINPHRGATKFRAAVLNLTTPEAIAHAKKFRGFETADVKEETILERGADSKGYYRPTEKGAGLTKKGAEHFGIQTAVTEKNPKGKRASRRKSFCARMSGMPGPMKDEKGRPTRKAMSLRRWRCR